MERVLRKTFAAAMAIAIVTVLLPVTARAEISDYWAEKDVDLRIEPHYENIAYCLDPIVTLQRFDDRGAWYWPATTSMNDSKLILTAATNASLVEAQADGLDNGMYFEVRLKVAATGTNVTLALRNDDTLNNVSVYLGTGNNFHGSYSGSSGTSHTNNFGAASAATWYKLGILFADPNVVFYAMYDNCTVIGYSQVSTANMTYDEIDWVELKQSVAAKTAYIDYFVQTSAHTDITTVGQASRALYLEPDESVTKYNVAYTLDDLKDVVTLSNESTVHDVIGYNPTGKDLANDNKLNESDLGEILLESPEDTDAKFRGKSVIKGWDSVRDASDESLENYLAGRHDVSRAYVIDYYVDDLKINISTSAGMSDKVEKYALKTFINEAGDEGAEITYDEEHGYYANWEDLDYVYVPRDVTSAEWRTMKEDVSNAVRKKCFSMVALTDSRPDEIVDPWFSVSSVKAHALGGLDIGTTWQATNALIGSILTGKDYAAVDGEDLDTEMAARSASMNTIEDGKTSTGPLSLVVMFASLLVWIVVITCMIIAAVLILGYVVRRKKHKGKHSK
jgi:hypothetical protein